MNLSIRNALRTAAAGLALAALAALAQPGGNVEAAGPNLVPNGDFAAGLSGWMLVQASGPVTSVNSYAVIDVTEDTPDAASVSAGRCVTNVGPGNYTISVDILIPGGQSR